MARFEHLFLSLLIRIHDSTRSMLRRLPVGWMLFNFPFMKRYGQHLMDAYVDNLRRPKLPWWIVDSAYPWMAKEFITQDLAANLEPLEDQFVSKRYVAEFEGHLQAISFELAGIVNTAALLLYSLVRHYKPLVFVESGTGRGYSTQIIARALQRNANGARLLTFGVNQKGCLDIARENLADFEFVTVIEGRTEEHLLRYTDLYKSVPIAFFIDGPKAKDPAFDKVLCQICLFNNILFVAIDDCQKHVPPGFDLEGRFPRGHVNLHRVRLMKLFKDFSENQYGFGFMSNEYSEEYEYLNRPIYAVRDTMRPYYFRRSKQLSHSFEIGVIYKRSTTDVEIDPLSR